MTTAPPPVPLPPEPGGAPAGGPGTARPRSIAANSASLAIAQAFVKVLGFGVVFVLTRAVSVEAYGRWAFAIAFAAMFQTVADPGADFHATRMVSRDPMRASEYLGASLVLKLALLPVLLATSLGIAWATGHRGEALWLVACAVGALWLLVAAGSYLSVLRGLRRMDYEAWFLITTRTAAFVLTLAALAAGAGVLGVGVAQVIANALGLPLVVWYAARSGIAPGWKRLRGLGRELLAGGLPFAATGLLVLVYFRVDMLMLSQMRGERSVGFYGAGTNLMFAALIPSQVLVSALFPVIAKSRSLAEPAAREVGRRAMTLSLLMSLPFAVGACLVGAPVLSLLYGRPYATAAPALSWLMLTLPWLYVNNLLGNCLGAVGRQRVVLGIAAVNLGVNVGLNLVLIPRMNYAGAALATLLSEICGTVFLALVMRRDMTALFGGRALAGLLVANALMAAAVWAARAWPIVAVLSLAAVLYLALVLALRLLKLSDLRGLRPAAGGGSAA